MSNIETLQTENAQLKALIKEGKDKFAFLVNILQLDKKINTIGLTLALPAIIRKVQSDPEIFQDIIHYIEKLNAIDFENSKPNTQHLK